MKSISELLEIRKYDMIIIPAMGSIIFMRIIQYFSGNKFNMKVFPMSGSLVQFGFSKDKMFENAVGFALETKISDDYDSKELKIAFIDERISGSSIKYFREKSPEITQNLIQKLKNKYKKNEKILNFTKSISIHIDFLAVIDMFRTLFDKNSKREYTDYMEEKEKEELKSLKENFLKKEFWSSKDEPEKKFIRLIKEYSKKHYKKNISLINKKVESYPGIKIKKIQDTKIDSLKKLPDELEGIFLISRLIYFPVASLFTEDIPEFLGLKYEILKIPYLIKVKNTIFIDILKEMLESKLR